MQIGDKMPDYLGLDQNGNPIKAENLRGQKVVLYFYPKDMTPGCTAQACSLRDGYEELRAQGYKVIGVSVDEAKSHLKFIEKNELPFDLISDTEHTLVETFGVWAEKKMCGKTSFGVVRTTFIIDERGNIERIMPKVKPDTNAEEILAFI